MTTNEYAISGSISFPKAAVDAAYLSTLRARLTLQSIGFRNNEGQTVYAYDEDADSFSVPRYFDESTFWPKLTRHDWVEPKLQSPFAAGMTLDPARHQPEAVQAMTDHLRAHSGGILIAPTGVGKTLIGLSIAANFNTPIGVLYYAAHMTDNWIDHVHKHLGVPKEEIGLVQEDRCDIGRRVTLLSVQSILSRRYPQALFDGIGFLIGDEVHRYGAAQWHKTLSRFPARYRLGMSADPKREDGLGPIINWTFGEVGFALRKREQEKATVYMYRFPSDYREKSYSDFVRVDGKWEQGDPNPIKYDRVLMNDKRRNAFVVEQALQARRKGRSIIVFAKRRDHCAAMHDLFVRSVTSDLPETKAALLLGGATTKAEKQALSEGLKADVLFATYGYCRDAMNAPHLDTLILATPPGNPLQPIGRLRDLPVEGKKPLLVVDVYEPNDYSMKRARRREDVYRSLDHPVKWLQGRKP